MEKDLPLQKCWMLADQAHVKSADFHILLLKSISTLVALGFQTMTVKHFYRAAGCNGKETEYASKAGQQPVDVLAFMNNALPF